MPYYLHTQFELCFPVFSPDVIMLLVTYNKASFLTCLNQCYLALLLSLNVVPTMCSQKLKKNTHFSLAGPLWRSEVSCWLAADHRRGRSPSWRAPKATDHRTRLQTEWSEWRTVLGLLQEGLWWTSAVLPALLCAQSVPAHLHERQWEEFNPSWAVRRGTREAPGPLWHCAVPGRGSTGSLHGDRSWKSGRATGTASSVCCRCQCTSWGHHASVA